jgi:hypothetical protein
MHTALVVINTIDGVQKPTFEKSPHLIAGFFMGASLNLLACGVSVDWGMCREL